MGNFEMHLGRCIRGTLCLDIWKHLFSLQCVEHMLALQERVIDCSDRAASYSSQLEDLTKSDSIMTHSLYHGHGR